MLHTIVPLEVVLDNSFSDLPQQQIIKIDGVQLMVEPIDLWEVKVIRVISSNPAHYLEPRFQPGSSIKLMK